MLLRKLLRLGLGAEKKGNFVPCRHPPQVMQERWHVSAGAYCLWVDETVGRGPFRAGQPGDGTCNRRAKLSCVLLPLTLAEYVWSTQLHRKLVNTTKAQGSVV